MDSDMKLEPGARAAAGAGAGSLRRARVRVYAARMQASQDSEEAERTKLEFNVFELINDELYRCLICDQVEGSLTTAIDHYWGTHVKRNYVCLACKVVFKTMDTLLVHEDICKASDADLVRTARYLLQHPNGPPFKMTRKQRRALKVPCSICGKMISNSNMNLHLLTHSEHPRFPCTVCVARFRTARSLQAHLNAHAGERPYQCDECPKAYTSDTALRAHKSGHRMEPFRCDICNKAFTRKYSLKAHKRTHTGEKPFLCGECGTAFTKRTSLQLHMRHMHLGLPPEHECTECGKRFSQLNSLKIHMKNHHNLDIITRKMFFNRLPELSSLLVSQFPNMV